ncbi:MAG TPA: hypothetical protein PKD53_27600 [Chloroflexaceae bacterium]|nr:hypothetical protein [Chloroflexaceae bacterium]
MHSERQRLYTRALLGVFAGGLALLLALWSYSTFAAASLSATPANPRQNDTVTLVGTGFSPGETVSVWITYPDYTVYGVAEVATNGDGSFSYPYLPDFLGATFTPTGRYTYTAHGQSSGREVYASIDVAIGQAPGTTAGVTLAAEPRRDTQGSYYIFSGAGYGTDEEVAVWLRYPDNHVEDLGRISAGPSGRIEYVLYVGGAPVGRYALTARGLRTGLNGISEFDVHVDDLTQATGQANLAVRSSPDNQRSYATFEGYGYQPREIVTVWATLPDYSTLWVGDVQASDDGSFVAVLYLSEQEPVGMRTYTAYGNTSGLRAVADYVLTPGGDPGGVEPAELIPIPDGVCEGEGCF